MDRSECWPLGTQCCGLDDLLAEEAQQAEVRLEPSFIFAKENPREKVYRADRMLAPCTIDDRVVGKKGVNEAEIHMSVVMGAWGIGPKVYHHDKTSMILESFDGDLHTLIKQSETVPENVERQVLALVRRLANRRILALDMKPQNVVYRRIVTGGRLVVRLIDFDPLFFFKVRSHSGFRPDPVTIRPVLEFFMLSLFMLHVDLWLHARDKLSIIKTMILGSLHNLNHSDAEAVFEEYNVRQLVNGFFLMNISTYQHYIAKLKNVLTT
jgi:hypothetical protein